MGFPSNSVITMETITRGLIAFASQMKQNAVEMRRQITFGEITAPKIESYLSMIRAYRLDAQKFIDAISPKLITYMQGTLLDEKLDITSALNDMLAAVAATDSYISAVLEKSNAGKLQTAFPVSALDGLKAQVELLLATIE